MSTIALIRRWIYRKVSEIEAWFQRTPIGNGPRVIKWSRDRWRHVTLKGQTSDPYTLRAQYLENGSSYTPFQRTSNRKWPMGYQMVTWLAQRSLDRDPNALKVSYLENCWICYLATILLITIYSLLWGSTDCTVVRHCEKESVLRNVTRSWVRLHNHRVEFRISTRWNFCDKIYRLICI